MIPDFILIVSILSDNCFMFELAAVLFLGSSNVILEVAIDLDSFSTHGME